MAFEGSSATKEVLSEIIDYLKNKFPFMAMKNNMQVEIYCMHVKEIHIITVGYCLLSGAVYHLVPCKLLSRLLGLIIIKESPKSESLI